NLKRAPDRRQQIKEQLDELGLKFEFIDATDAKEGLSDEEMDLIGREEHPKYEDRVRVGEIGCLISHLRCYQKLLNSSSEYALILEDDALFEKEFVSVLAQIIKSDVNYNVMQLGYDLSKQVVSPWLGKSTMPLNLLKRRSLGISTAENKPYYVGPVYSNIFCTHCYLISRRGCELLLSAHKKVLRPIDALLNEAGIPLRFALVPVIAHQSPGEPGNYINYDQKGDNHKEHKNLMFRILKQLENISPHWFRQIIASILVLCSTKAPGYYRRLLKNAVLRKRL
ncbi:MAG: glycosyltransferase family 25 protein, partial [Gammaproteobacteria bacterium]|nr:glycosyltransferase family 25 protein [Gammaproteobacteria bacterium]